MCTGVTDILKMCIYLSESKTCNFDKITAGSYLETLIRSSYYKMAFLSSAQILQLNYFEQKKINVGLEKKKIQPLPNFTRYGWNRMAQLSDQLFPTQMSNFLLQILDIYRRIACNFLFLLKEAGDGYIGGVGEQA